MSNLLSLASRKLPTLISTQTIKPSSPVPSHLKTYNLSIVDQFSPSIYMPVVFFYPNYNDNSSSTAHFTEKAAQLKNSLSQTLTQYYPFSGRLAEGASYVDCNDEGVEFFEVQINAPLSELIRSHNFGYQSLDQFFPTNGAWGPVYPNCSLVMVQLSYFTCGGLAIAVSVSHKLGGASTLFSFITHWAVVTKRNTSGDQQVLALPPHFISSPKSEDAPVSKYKLNKGNNIVVTKKFVFPNSKIAQLKAMATAETTNPTKFEVVTSLIHGCAVRAAKKISSGDDSGKSYALALMMNLGNRMVGPLPETTVGNISWDFSIPTTNESELALNSLTARIKKLKMELTGVTNSQRAQWVTQAAASQNVTSDTNKVVEVFLCSSMCGFPLYRMDFGWGKPIRASIGGLPMKNAFFLMDTPTGDGIEALVALEEQNMEAFQNDEQLLAFTRSSFSAL